MKISTTMARRAVLLGLLLGAACDDASKGATPPTKSAAAEPAPKDPEPAKAPPAPEVKAEAKAEAPPPSSDEAAAPVTIGVPECDDYVAKMTECFRGDEIPAEIRDSHRTGFELTVKSWADSASSEPGDGAHLVPACKAAASAAKRSFPGCFKGG